MIKAVAGGYCGYFDERQGMKGKAFERATTMDCVLGCGGDAIGMASLNFVVMIAGKSGVGNKKI